MQVTKLLFLEEKSRLARKLSRLTRPVDNLQLINKDKSIHDTRYKFLVFIHRSQQDASGNSTNTAQGGTSFYGNYRDYSEME